MTSPRKRKSTRVRRHERRVRMTGLIRDGFDPGEAEFLAQLNWKLGDSPLKERRVVRRREVRELKKRGWSNERIEEFFFQQWVAMNESELVSQLIDEKYQQSRRTGRRARAA